MEFKQRWSLIVRARVEKAIMIVKEEEDSLAILLCTIFTMIWFYNIILFGEKTLMHEE